MKRLDRQNSEDLFNQMQKMIEEFQNKGMNMATEFTSHMPIDMREEENQIIISADLPGVQKEDIDIKASGKNVQITAESKHEIKEENEKYIRKERNQRSFRRSVNWPKEIKEDTIEAKYEDGVLEIKAKKEEGSDRNIEIK